MTPYALVTSWPIMIKALNRIVENIALAARLREYADLLEAQDADGFRVRAYRRAADVVTQLQDPVHEILRTGGRAGLVALPAIGSAIASALAEMVSTGHWSQLERLRGNLQPELLFQSIAGIGSQLSKRLCEALHIETLEALEIAAHDGRLENVPGFGKRRAQLIRTALAERLGRPRLWNRNYRVETPPVEILLDVDREYRARARAGELRYITPKRFNAKGEAWLPILHTRRGPWQITALYSNTAAAHEFGRTLDWVVIYYHTDATPEGQCTIVTEATGVLKGRRVVRGREQECLALLKEAERLSAHETVP